MKKIRQKSAFSLIEIIIAIIIISVIMTALAPIITKKLKRDIALQTTVTEVISKGLEIYTNPGVYSLDVPTGITSLFIQGAGGGGGGAGASYSEQTKSFTSTSTWTVPKGVNQITLSITGSGGGGGGSNGKSTGNSACLSNEFLAIRGSSDETDLCYMRGFLDPDDASQNSTCFVKVLNPNETCTHVTCVWRYKNPITSEVSYQAQASTSTNGALATTNRGIYTLVGAQNACLFYRGSDCGNHTGYRLPNDAELKKVIKYINTWSIEAGAAGLNLCTRDGTNYNTNANPKVSFCSEGAACVGNANAYCLPFAVASADGNRLYFNSFSQIFIDTVDANTNNATVKCAKSLVRYNRYSGAGGASGAIIKKTINVMPNDTFEITIGAGGALGAARTKGSQGGTTKVIHRRNGIELGTYYVKGGLGGNAATESANGAAYTNGTATGNTTPSGTCYAKYRTDASATFSGGATSCTTLSYSGSAGTASSGGNGGRVNNSGTITQGGASSGGYLYLDSTRGATTRATNNEINLAKGQDANTNGFGGGGGFTPNWAASASNFYQGGRGAKGKVDITYKIALPGGGGGSGSRVGGVDDSNQKYEIEYKVNEGDRIIITVGSGGQGGSAGQNGFNGSASVIGDNDIVFFGGEGGKIPTSTEKTSLIGGRGGNSGYINETGATESTTSGMKIKSKTPATTYTITPTGGSFKGQNGKRGGVPSSTDIQSGYSVSGTIFEYGYSGGMGGSPFGVASSYIGTANTCGGGIYGTLGLATNIDYICTSGKENGNDAKGHNAANNDLGGSGGGGGGVLDSSSEYGQGGSGSNGYIRVRWE